MASLFYDSLSWQFGILYVVSSYQGLHRVFVTEDLWNDYLQQQPQITRDNEVCREAIEQLDQYFNGSRTMFTLPLAIAGSPFNKKIWECVQSIPYGKTMNYRTIACAIGSDKAARAVGNVNRCNPLPIIIPCHRVIASDGSLGGYLGNNVALKQFLLDLEKNFVTRL